MTLLDRVREILTVGYVYILFHGQVDADGRKAYKIGMAEVIMERLLHYLNCQLYNPDRFKVIAVFKLDKKKYKKLERELHHRFEESRSWNKKKKSEWFWVTEQEMEACIAEVAARDDVDLVPEEECFGKIDVEFVKAHYDLTFIVHNGPDNIRYARRLNNIRHIQEGNPNATLRDIIEAKFKHVRTGTAKKEETYTDGDLVYDIKRGYIQII